MPQGIASPMENRRNNGWIHRNDRLPTKADASESGKLFAWHVYQGAILCHFSDFTKNAFHVYWMRFTDEMVEPWINAMEKLPTKEDADMMNCVLAKNRYEEVSITGYHQFHHNSALIAWKRLPTPPSDYRELRKEY